MSDLGTLGKFKVISYFIEKEYDVFVELDGKSPFDIVIHKEGILEKVEIKTTNTRNRNKTGWAVQLKKVRANRTKNKITNFDSNKCDLIAVYINKINKVVILKSKDIKVKCELTVLDKDLR